jgi:hypothetical protein
MMTHSTKATLALLFLTAGPLSAAPAVSPLLRGTRSDGTRIVLKSFPEFLQRALVPVVPNAVNTFAIANQKIEAVVEAPSGFTVDIHNGALSVAAPAGERSGYARVRIGGREVTLTLVNLVPSTSVRRGWLDGYRIGEYLTKPLRGLASYEKPKGFIRLTAANAALWVSDHYRLRDFQCKLDGASKFLILRTEALVKLELLQNELQTRHGLKFDRFTIMSGYRTPYYNSMIGNETSYSRHLYGDAMDIFIDTKHRGRMDDINHDGRVDAGDAKFLFYVAEAIDNSKEWSWLKGGAGVYHATSAHGPYLHVDARGYVARWGV